VRSGKANADRTEPMKRRHDENTHLLSRDRRHSMACGKSLQRECCTHEQRPLLSTNAATPGRKCCFQRRAVKRIVSHLLLHGCVCRSALGVVLLSAGDGRQDGGVDSERSARRSIAPWHRNEPSDTTRGCVWPQEVSKGCTRLHRATQGQDLISYVPNSWPRLLCDAPGFLRVVATHPCKTLYTTVNRFCLSAFIILMPRHGRWRLKSRAAHTSPVTPRCSLRP